VIRFAFTASALLAALGIFLAIIGISSSEMKPFAIGIVLLLGAGVFAILSLAALRGPVGARTADDDLTWRHENLT
jgi:hypothetical protein